MDRYVHDVQEMHDARVRRASWELDRIDKGALGRGAPTSQTNQVSL